MMCNDAREPEAGAEGVIHASLRAAGRWNLGCPGKFVLGR
jgi:hypothetical protein